MKLVTFTLSFEIEDATPRSEMEDLMAGMEEIAAGTAYIIGLDKSELEIEDL